MSNTTALSASNENDPASQFASLLQVGISAWTKAGEIVAREMEKDPSFPERVAAKFKHISEHTVRVFQRIGKKLVHPELYMSDKPGARALLRLPYSLQEKHIKEPELAQILADLE